MFVHMVSQGAPPTQSAPLMDAIAQSLALALDLIAAADAQLLHIVALSLRVSLTACAVGALAGWLVLSERLTLLQGLAIAMVMAASMGTAWSSGRAAASEAL